MRSLAPACLRRKTMHWNGRSAGNPIKSKTRTRDQENPAMEDLLVATRLKAQQGLWWCRHAANSEFPPWNFPFTDAETSLGKIKNESNPFRNNFHLWTATFMYAQCPMSNQWTLLIQLYTGDQEQKCRHEQNWNAKVHNHCCKKQKIKHQQHFWPNKSAP